MEIAVIADDLTGAADTGVQLVRAGYRAAVVFRGESLPKNLDAVALDTDSRTKPTGLATKRVVEVGKAVRHARIVYKKLDSTLRGSVAAELSAAIGATQRNRVVVAPAFPAAGRTTMNGVQLVHGVPVHETEMRNDPRTPVKEAHVPTLLREVFASVATLGVEDLAYGEHVRRALKDNECVVVDAERDADLETLVRAVPDPSSVLWAGSAGLALALGSIYPGSRRGSLSAPEVPARRVLVVIGSLSGVAREQLARISEEYGEVAIPARGGGSGAVTDAGDAARRALAESGCAVLHSPEKRGKSRGAGSFVRALANVVEVLAGDGAFDALVLTGGSTAMGVARRLGASGIKLVGEVEAGVPVGALIGPRPYRVVTKAGGFGGPDTLLHAVRTLTQNEEENSQ